MLVSWELSTAILVKQSPYNFLLLVARRTLYQNCHNNDGDFLCLGCHPLLLAFRILSRARSTRPNKSPLSVFHTSLTFH